MLKLSKNQQQRMGYAKNRLIDLWNIDITIISIEDLQDIVNKKTNTYYPAKDMKTLLSHLYDRAVAQQYVTTNLAKFIELPTLEETEQTPFNDNEIKAFWKDYGEGNLFTGYILLMIYSGMMPGELMECTKDLIDWNKQTIFGCGLKTKKRRSTPIVVADIVLPVLRELADSSPDERLLPYSKKQFYKLYDETIARCGVRQLPPYSCRHTTATVLTNIEDNIAVVKEVMRHSKYQTTQRYIHLDTVPMLNAVNKMSETETAKD
jgi:integrase